MDQVPYQADPEQKYFFVGSLSGNRFHDQFHCLYSEKHLEDETFRRDMYGRYAQP